jgi:hypothetical protein
VLRTFGSKRDEVAGEWRNSPHVFRVIKSRRMRWAGNVERTGERRGVYRVLVGRPE